MPTPTLKHPPLNPLPEECYIILAQVGALTIVYLPGDGISILGPEDPGWGKFSAEFGRAFESAQTLAQLGAKDPAVRRKAFALAEEMLKPVAKELTTALRARVPVHA